MHEANLRQMESKLGPDHPSTLNSRGHLAAVYETLGRWAAAETLRRDTLDRRRKTTAPSSPLLAGDLAFLGANLLGQARWSDAEPVLRECLTIREKTQADHWRTCNTRSLLGGSLTGQKKFAEAEPLVLAGYEGMEACEAKIPAPDKPNLTKAAERVVQLYETWGRPGPAAVWRRKLGLADLPADVFASP
jgi:hypothetical protein